MKSMKARDVVKRLIADGWTLVRVEGSHHIYKRAADTIVVPIHGLNRELSFGVLQDIAKKAGWK